MTDPSSFPLITIVIPTYNRKKLLQKAIASVVRQTYSNWQMIIADDGSTDGTAELIKSFSDSRITIIELPHTGHIGNVRNAGAVAGTGEWIAFLDSDDAWMPGKLELQLNALKKNKARWCYTNFELINELEQTIPLKAGAYKAISGWIIKQLLTTEVAVTMCSVLLQRSLFEDVKGFSTNPRLMYRGDYELALRLALKAEVIALPDVLVRILEHEGRVTNGLENGYERSALAYEIFLNSKPEKELKYIAKKKRGFQLAEAASHNFKNKNYSLACKQFADAFTSGIGLRSWFSALYRGVKPMIKSKLVAEQ